MNGDPFVSLVIAILFGIVFYKYSSIPTGQEHHESKQWNDAHARESEVK
jgi:hypothetical protein